MYLREDVMSEQNDPKTVEHTETTSETTTRSETAPDTVAREVTEQSERVVQDAHVQAHPSEYVEGADQVKRRSNNGPDIYIK